MAKKSRTKRLAQQIAEDATRRVATYIPRSTDEDHQPFSLEAQEIKLRAFVASQPGDWQIVAAYSDDASGATTDRRDLQKAPRAARAGSNRGSRRAQCIWGHRGGVNTPAVPSWARAPPRRGRRLPAVRHPHPIKGSDEGGLRGDEPSRSAHRKRQLPTRWRSMPAPDPAHAADNPEPDTAGHEPPASASSRSRPKRRDRHGRREPSTPPSASTGPRKTTRPHQATHDPRWMVQPPETVDMTPDEYCQAVLAWTFLFASWWTDNPPGQHDQ